MEIDPLPPISVVKAPTPETEGVAHVIADATVAPGVDAKKIVADDKDPRWEFAINRNVKCAIGND